MINRNSNKGQESPRKLSKYYITTRRIRLILIYYILLCLVGLFFSFVALSPDFILSYTPDIMLLALIGSLGMSTVGSTIFYIRRIYKICIRNQIEQPDNKSTICQLGITIYFIIRPVFALGFAVLVVVGILAGMLNIALKDAVLSYNFIYLCMFVSFFSGFSTGTIITLLEKFGLAFLRKIFKTEEIDIYEQY